ncbi:hypothetical protein REPUB_Repub01dG0072900 [Reevesia pubescens]
MASRNMSFQLLFIFFLALFSRFYQLEAAGFNSNIVGCIEMERKALLKLKGDLIIPLVNSLLGLVKIAATGQA